MCFKYPIDWQLKETSSSGSSSDYVTVISPSGAILVNYIPAVTGVGGACPSGCFFKAESIDQIA